MKEFEIWRVWEVLTLPNSNLVFRPGHFGVRAGTAGCACGPLRGVPQEGVSVVDPLVYLFLLSGQPDGQGYETVCAGPFPLPRQHLVPRAQSTRSPGPQPETQRK